MSTNKFGKASSELVLKAYAIDEKIDRHLLRNEFREAFDVWMKDVRGDDALLNGLSIDEVDMVARIREPSEARAELIKDLILRGNLLQAKEKLESTTFSPIYDEERYLNELLALKQRETQPHLYDWRGDPRVQGSIKKARLTPSQAEEFYTLLENGRLRPHVFPSYSIERQNIMTGDNLLPSLARAFKNGDLESEDVIERYGL